MFVKQKRTRIYMINKSTINRIQNICTPFLQLFVYFYQKHKYMYFRNILSLAYLKHAFCFVYFLSRIVISHVGQITWNNISSIFDIQIILPNIQSIIIIQINYQSYDILLTGYICFFQFKKSWAKLIIRTLLLTSTNLSNEIKAL